MLKFIYRSDISTVIMSLLVVIPAIFISSCAINTILSSNENNELDSVKHEILLADGTTTFLNRKEIYASKIHNIKIFYSHLGEYYFNYLDKDFYITEATSLDKTATLERAINNWYVIWMDLSGKIHIAYDLKSDGVKDILIVRTNPDIYSTFKATDNSGKYNSLR